MTRVLDCRREATHRAVRHVLAVLVSGAMVAGCSVLSDTSASDSTVPVAAPLDWNDRGGKYPDTEYAVPIEPRWGAESLQVGTWIAAESYDGLDSIECEGVAADLPTESADTPSRSVTIELGPVETVKIDCLATFDDGAVAYGVEWPNVFRDDNGKIDPERSDLSRCHVGSGDGPVPTAEDLVPGSRLIECDLASSIARSSPSDYWLSPQPLIIYP